MPATTRRLKMLHLEDSDLDHQLTLANIRRGGLDVDATRVEGRADFLHALKLPWDVIVSDYNLPGFSGLVALELANEAKLLTPFILVSGEIGEDVAVEAMRNGASDYLLKNNLARLVPAMLHAIEASEAKRARLASERALAESKKRLQELAQHLQVSVEMERAAIAREVHDDVGGSLTALKFDLAWISRHTDSAEVQQRVASALETVTSAIEASQRVMHNLRPAILEEGLVAALQWMTNRFERRTAVTSIFRTSHDAFHLPAGVPLVVYRTAQEALTNVTKHAQATRVELDLTFAGGVLSLEVADNGRGLSQEDLAKVRSFGIRGLHERAGTVGGWVDLSSGPNGTTLILSIPIEPQENGGLLPTDPSDPHDPTAWGDL